MSRKRTQSKEAKQETVQEPVKVQEAVQEVKAEEKKVVKAEAVEAKATKEAEVAKAAEQAFVAAVKEEAKPAAKAEEPKKEAPVTAVVAPAAKSQEAPKAEEVKPAVNKVAPKLNQTEAAFVNFVEHAKQHGTTGEKMVIDAMESYLATMNASAPLTVDQVVREQQKLYGLFRNIGRRTDDFQKTVVMCRAYFKQNYDKAFHDTKINRGHEALTLTADDRKAFYSYLQLYKILASVNDLKDVNKLVSVNRSLDNPAVPAEVVEKYVALFS